MVAGAIQGGVQCPRRESVFPYVECIERMAYCCENEGYREYRVLLIGLGAGLLPRQFSLGVCRTVEVDPRIVDIAKRFFGFDPQQYPVGISDGRAFLRQTRTPFEAIVLDAYGGGNYPYHLFTQEFFALARQHLFPDGILVVNLLGFVSGVRRRTGQTCQAGPGPGWLSDSAPSW